MDRAFEGFVATAQAMTGLPDLDPAWLDEVWLGADRDVNVAMNHVLRAA